MNAQNQSDTPVLVGIGANLPSTRHPRPLDACKAALEALSNAEGVRVVKGSRWFESEPVPKSDQPWFVNAVVRVETDLGPLELLEVLHAIEADFGRVRTVANAPRVLDLDLLAFENQIIDHKGVHIPHARLRDRAFVLLPMADVAPGWTHPKTGEKLTDLLQRLPQEQVCRPIVDA